MADTADRASSATPERPESRQDRWRQPPAAAAAAAGKSRRYGLNRADIVRAAVEIADADGLDAVSMANLANSLGCGTMSLYRHVADKDELLLLMHDAAWQPVDPPGTPSTARASDASAVAADWRSGLSTWCLDQRDLLRQHPWLERIQLDERGGTSSFLAWLDRGLQILASTPLTEHDKTELLLMLCGYVYWEARLHAEAHPPGVGTSQPGVGTSQPGVGTSQPGVGTSQPGVGTSQPGVGTSQPGVGTSQPGVGTSQPGVGTSQPGAAPGTGDLMRQVVDTERFPGLARALAGGAFDGPADRHGDFTFGLDRILDGISCLIADRGREARP